MVENLLPELKDTNFGDEVNLSRYPNLKTIVQTENLAMKGVNKFRDIAVYTSPSMSVRQIPENQESAITHIALSGSQQHEYTSS